jgi:hypothetical protein
MPQILVEVEQSVINSWSAYFNKLTPAQLERLAILGEEMAEAQHVIGKILRHGYASVNPDRPTSANKLLLQDELGHVAFAVSMLTEAGDLSEAAIDAQRKHKARSIAKYLHHN